METSLESPAGLAIDWVTNKLYWTDAGKKSHFMYSDIKYHFISIFFIDQLSRECSSI